MALTPVKAKAPLSMGNDFRHKLPLARYKTDLTDGYPVAYLGQRTDKDADYTQIVFPPPFVNSFVRNNKFAFPGFPVKVPRLAVVVGASPAYEPFGADSGFTLEQSLANLLPQIAAGQGLAASLAATDVTTFGFVGGLWFEDVNQGGSLYSGQTILFIQFDGAYIQYHDKFDSVAVEPTPPFQATYTAFAGAADHRDRFDAAVGQVGYYGGKFSMETVGGLPAAPQAATAATTHFSRAFVSYGAYAPTTVGYHSGSGAPDLAAVKTFFGLP